MLLTSSSLVTARSTRSERAFRAPRIIGELVARRKDGALIGPFNGWLHFPRFGGPAWAFNKALVEHSVLPATIQQTVTLVTAAKSGARYEMYGHEYFARRAGLAEDKIATIAAALNRGGPLPESTYRVTLTTFGEDGLAEIVFLVGCFSMVGVILNAFDASVPGREEGLDMPGQANSGP
jgi:4-carboxymuconolactone decarboxylase